MKVCKFGGSSFADANQVKKVCDIIKGDPDRKIIVVSAPGKINDSDIKITDLLIECANQKLSGGDYKTVLNKIVDKYRNIALGFNLNESILDTINKDLESRIDDKSLSASEFMDSMKAAGEDNSAKLVAHCLKSLE